MQHTTALVVSSHLRLRGDSLRAGRDRLLRNVAHHSWAGDDDSAVLRRSRRYWLAPRRLRQFKKVVSGHFFISIAALSA